MLTCRLTLFLLLFIFTGPALSAEKTVIASNGAAKGMIEHTLTAVTLAATTEIDYLELHVVMTADDELIVFRDLTLNRLTDVAGVFPGRNRADGGFYPIDFSLNEIRQLRLQNVFESGNNSLSLPIPTLGEELSLIRLLEQRLEKQIGIALEIRYPWFHSREGKAISEATLTTLARFGYGQENSKLYLQCFDPEELQRIHDKLMPATQLSIPLIQLIGANNSSKPSQQRLGRLTPYSYDWLFTNIGIRVLTSYVAAVALPSSSIFGKDGNLLLAQYIDRIQQHGLKVFAYPVDDTPETFLPSTDSFHSVIELFYTKGHIDGIYTDSYAEALGYKKTKTAQQLKKTELPSFFSETDPLKTNHRDI